MGPYYGLVLIIVDHYSGIIAPRPSRPMVYGGSNGREHGHLKMAVFFLINGMLLIMFDELLAVGICVILLSRSLTPYSQAVERKQWFSPYETTIYCLFGLWN